LDDPEPSLTIVGIVLCLTVLGFTSAVDAAFSAISRHRLNNLLDEQGPRTRTITWLLDEPHRVKSTILLLNTVMIVVATSWAIDLTTPIVLTQLWWSLGLLLIAMLVLSEMLPKALVARNPEAMALLLAGPLGIVTWLFWPLTSLLNLLMRPLYSLISGKIAPAAPLVSEEELRMVVTASEEKGVIEYGERQMIESVISFGDTLLREIMVPRVDVIAVDVDAPLAEALDVAIQHGHSRIPIYDGTLDKIEGILYVKDLLPTLRDGTPERSLRSLLRPARFVPETMRVNALLKDIQKRKVHIAIAVDEYGGVSGIATIEDLIELIVGEIQDEYDREEPDIQELEPGVFMVDATALIDDINEATGLELESEEADRIGGLVTEVLGRVPEEGDEIAVGDGLIQVVSMKGVRVQQLRVSRRPTALVLNTRARNGEGGMHHE
jgi:putative hemolysin